MAANGGQADPEENADWLPPPFDRPDPQQPASRGGQPPREGKPHRPDPLGKHCWVVDAPGHHGSWPALLVQWKRDADGEWSGQVAVVAGTADAPRPVEIWISARYLRPL